MFGQCEGAGTSSYIMRPGFDVDINLFLRSHLQRYGGFSLDMCFTYELHGKSREFCLANGDCSSTTFFWQLVERNRGALLQRPHRGRGEKLLLEMQRLASDRSGRSAVYTHSCDRQDSWGLDLGIVGIPCPLFSVLNQRRHSHMFNPFLERLGFRTLRDSPIQTLTSPRKGSAVVMGALRLIRRHNPKIIIIEEAGFTITSPKCTS